MSLTMILRQISQKTLELSRISTLHINFPRDTNSFCICSSVEPICFRSIFICIKPWAICRYVRIISNFLQSICSDVEPRGFRSDFTVTSKSNQELRKFSNIKLSRDIMHIGVETTKRLQNRFQCHIKVGQYNLHVEPRNVFLYQTSRRNSQLSSGIEPSHLLTLRFTTIHDAHSWRLL